MTDVPPDLLHRFRAHRQGHVFVGWESLPPARRAAFVEQLAGVDLAELESLFAAAHEPAAPAAADQIAPIPVLPAVASAAERATGEAALRRGEVAALVVAGGQGSRLGFDRPKGMYPVGPVSGASLFQVHAEKVLAVGRRYGKPVPFLVMTSPATDVDTRDYFRENRFFGLDPADVIFFQQGTMPAVDAGTGRLLLEAPGRLFLSPNGHGGTLTAVAECGVLDDLDRRGVRHVFYFQVDNPLVKVCDPEFIGRHVAARSEASSKVVFKDRPEEKVGVFAVLNGRCGLIEYSDLPADLAAERDPDGTLRYRAGNPAIHLFAVEFLTRLTSTGGLPFHTAKKSVPHFDPETGSTVTPERPNALKFERFVFDALPLAERWLAVETPRAEEFAPLKNATGADSPETVRAAQIALHAGWLEQAGVPTHGHPVEVSPLFALDADELRAKIPPGLVVGGPTYLR
jgi:UDP-N-acetylglucosamine/UDP-N-acetylgalactosamine diphosphorylase